MADPTPNPQNSLYEEAIKQHDRYFQNTSPQGQRLTEKELSIYSNYRVGWRSNVEIKGEQYPVHVLLPTDFPFTKPKIVLVDKTKYLKWPHVESDGTLCLMTSHTNTIISSGTTLVDHLLTVEAPALIEECVSGTNQEDFISEFHSYWPARTTRIWSLLPVDKKAQVGVCRKINRFMLVGENEEQVKRWAKQYLGKRDTSQPGYTKMLYIWLTKPPIPVEHPQSGSDFLQLLSREPVETQQFFFDNFPISQNKCLVLFGFDASGVATLSGAWLRQSQTKLEKGFRKGRVPRKIKMMRYHGNKKNLIPTHVQRVDPGWIHARGGESSIQHLQSKTVGIVGCGSVGSLVAETLAKAGVGDFSFYDPDILSWDNVARHALGGRYVGNSKSKGLTEYIQKDFPHIKCHSNETTTWEKVFSDDPNQLKSCDLLISTIGDWSSEAHLNFSHRTVPDFPTVLYGWTEAHACAGHALLVKDLGGCLNCGMDEMGNFQKNVVTWEETETMEQVPACGAFYQPYGIADLLPIVSMIANLAIQELGGKITRSRHSVWVGAEEKIISCGGNISPGLFKEGEKGSSRMVEMDWRLKAGCQLCR